MDLLKDCFDDQQKLKLHCKSQSGINFHDFHCYCCTLQENKSICSSYQHIHRPNLFENMTLNVFSRDFHQNETVNFLELINECTATDGNEFFCQTEKENKHKTECGCRSINNKISGLKNFTSDDIWGEDGPLFATKYSIFEYETSSIVMTSLVFLTISFFIFTLFIQIYLFCKKNSKTKIQDNEDQLPIYLTENDETDYVLEIE